MVQGPIGTIPVTKHWLTYSQTLKRFALDSNHVSIRFDAHGADVGCHRISIEAMNALMDKWREFNGPTREKVVQ